MMKKLLIVLVLCVFSGAFVNGNEDKKPEAFKMKPALLVIDIQNYYLPMVPEREKEVAMYMINSYIELFRKYNIPIIRVYNIQPGVGPMEGTKEFEFPETVNVLPSDAKVIKNKPNAFTKTDLDKILKEKGCNTVFLCGLSSVGCVLATYFGAYDLDYSPILLKSAIMSHNSEYTKSIEDIFGAVNQQIVTMLIASAKQ